MAIMSGVFDPTFSVPHWLSAAIGYLPVPHGLKVDAVPLSREAGRCSGFRRCGMVFPAVS